MFLRALAAFLILPVVVAGLVPWWIGNSDPNRLNGSLVGVIPVAVGLVVLVWCVRNFYVVGRGTLAHWEPPKHLVTVGPHAYVRNPMYVAVLSVLVGWIIWTGSPWLVFYTLLVGIGFHLHVVLVEEPWLDRTFGAQWHAYAGNVRRWLPRQSPWHRDS